MSLFHELMHWCMFGHARPGKLGPSALRQAGPSPDGEREASLHVEARKNPHKARSGDTPLVNGAQPIPTELLAEVVGNDGGER